MAIRTKTELLDAIKNYIGNDSGDSALAIIEDVNDTVTDMETRAAGDGIDWKTRFEENDNAWREKYKARFFDPSVPPPDPQPNTDPQPVKTFDELFEEKE